MSKKTIILLLTFFLGGFGAHHFYRGKTLIGLLYLLFCLTFIPAVIATIEFIYYCFQPEEYFERA